MLVCVVKGYSLSNAAGELGFTLEEAVRLKDSLMEKLRTKTTADLVRLGIYAQVDEDH